jgi:hypothetical protein
MCHSLCLDSDEYRVILHSIKFLNVTPQSAVPMSLVLPNKIPLIVILPSVIRLNVMALLILIEIFVGILFAVKMSTHPSLYKTWLDHQN